MPDVDGQWVQLMERMKHLPPLRNVNAMRSWLEVMMPSMVGMFDKIAQDAAKGGLAAKRIVRLMFIAFAAGRAYQAANPDAPRDPDGYGG